MLSIVKNTTHHNIEKVASADWEEGRKIEKQKTSENKEKNNDIQRTIKNVATLGPFSEV
jgi:hypothetical protein